MTQTNDAPSTEQQSKKTTTFKTKDINQAAFIWCQAGTKIEKLIGQSQQRKGTTVHFAFTLTCSEEELHQLQIDYANGDTVVEPKMYCQKQNDLRDLLHSTLGLKTGKK